MNECKKWFCGKKTATAQIKIWKNITSISVLNIKSQMANTSYQRKIGEEKLMISCCNKKGKSQGMSEEYRYLSALLLTFDEWLFWAVHS